MNNSVRLRHSIRAISPVISVLLMIAIAVVASLVVYAWVTGYIGGTTSTAGKAIQIQSVSRDPNSVPPGLLTVYVQNVGQGVVEFKAGESVYVNDNLVTITSALQPLAPGETVSLLTNKAIPDSEKDEKIDIKVTTTDGTFMTRAGTIPTSSSSSPPGGNVVPVADFTFSANNLVVQFTDASTDSDGTIASRLWDFGDTQTSTATSPSHTYGSAGTYTVRLTVTDNGGATDDDLQGVTVNAEPQQVTFVAAGTTSMAHGADVRPYYPAPGGGLQSGDLIILQVLARGDSHDITVPSDFSPLPLGVGWISDSSGTSGVARVTQGIYHKWATGGESGQITVSVSGSYNRVAIMYAFRNVATTNFLESVSNSLNTAHSSVLTAPTVNTAGPKRLAVTFVACGTNRALVTFSGYTEQLDINVNSNNDSLSELGLDTATMDLQGTLNGGTQNYNTCDWIVRSFALVPR